MLLAHPSGKWPMEYTIPIPIAGLSHMGCFGQKKMSGCYLCHLHTESRDF